MGGVQTGLCIKWGLGFLSKYLISERTQKDRIKNYRYAMDKVKSRMNFGASRGDFWDNIVVRSEKNELTGEGMNEPEVFPIDDTFRSGILLC